MLDFGFIELIFIIAVAVIAIGPKELPGLMRGLGNLMRRISYAKYAFTSQFDEFMKDADLDDIRNGVNFETKRRSAEFDEAAEDEDVLPDDEKPSDEDQGEKA